MLYYFTFCGLSVLALALPKKVDISGNVLTTEKAEGRIAGGMETNTVGQFDYQVQLVVNGERLCSGVIVNEYYLLTAAHCVDDTTPEDVFAVAGTNELNVGNVIEISEIILHPDYDFPRQDIAIMRTVAPIDFRDTGDPTDINPSHHRYISRAFLQDVGEDLPSHVYVSGWGDQGNGEVFSEYLMYVKLSVISHLRCQAMYPEVMITQNMICAENPEDGGQGACWGDGGAPATGTYYRRVVGLSSFTRGCGPGMGPSVFTYIGAREIHDFIRNGTRL